MNVKAKNCITIGYCCVPVHKQKDGFSAENNYYMKAVYVAIGIRLSGQKEVLGMWIGGNESAKYWLGVLNEIKNRGVEDIMIVSVDTMIIYLIFFNPGLTSCR